MKIHNITGPSLISQVGSISTFGCMLQFHIFLFFLLSNLCVHSVQSRQKVKLNNANVHSSITVVHEREKESAINMCVYSLVLACVSVYMFLYVYVHQEVHICVTLVCAGGERGVGLCACV